MSNGKLQVEAKLKVDVSEASVLQNKLRDLAKEQEKVAQVAQRTQKAASQFNYDGQKRMTTVLLGFSQGGMEGGLSAIAKVAPKLQGSIIGILGSLFLVQQAFQVGWNAGLMIIDKTIGKLDRMAEASAKAAKAIYEGIKNAQKVSFEKAEKRIEKNNKTVDDDSGYRLSGLSRAEREAAANRQLQKARGGEESPPSASFVDEAAERLRAQQEKFNTLKKEYDAQKEVADRDLKTAQERMLGTPRAEDKNRLFDEPRRDVADNAGEMAAIARLQGERVATLAETLAAEKRKRDDLEAELKSAQTIAGINTETYKAELDVAKKKAAEKATTAKHDYEESRKTPAQVLQDALTEADLLKQKFQSMAEGVKRSETEAEYWQKLKQASGMQDAISQKTNVSLPIASDAYARIGGYLGGAGGSGIDYTRRTAAATEKSATLLHTIVGKLQPAPQSVATWG